MLRQLKLAPFVCVPLFLGCVFLKTAQQCKVFFPAHVGGSEIVFDYEYRNGRPIRDYNRSRYSRLCINKVIPFTSDARKASFFKYSSQFARRNRNYFRHEFRDSLIQLPQVSAEAICRLHPSCNSLPPEYPPESPSCQPLR